MNYPRLSIITPSYNQGEFLEATIKSVLDQGYPNLEYIIIDGGSTDNSVEIIKKYEQHLAYWVSEKDKGQTDAINKGLEKSTGDILGWINSDDVYVRGTFRKIIKAFQSHPEHIVVHGDRLLLDRSGNVAGWSSLPPFDPYRHGFTVCSETAFWRREAMASIGLLNDELQFAMDVDFFCRLYKKGKLLKINQYLGCFRCYDDNKSSTIGHIGKEEAERIWAQLFGAKNVDWLPAPRTSPLRHYARLIRHPLLIGLPFISYKLHQV